MNVKEVASNVSQEGRSSTLYAILGGEEGAFAFAETEYENVSRDRENVYGLPAYAIGGNCEDIG